MKRIAIAVLAFAATAAHADDAIVRANNQATLSLGMHNLDYRETDPWNRVPGDLDSEKGTQADFGLGITRQGSVFGIDNIYTAASVSVAVGDTTYQGYLMDFSTGQFISPLTSQTTSVTTDVSLRLGKSIPFGSRHQFQVTPYIAYGYHNWVRAMHGSATEDYSHHELGGGLLGQFAATDKLVLSADAQVTKAFAGGTTNPDYETFKIVGKAVTRVGVGVDYAVSRRLHIGASYQYTHFQYGKSPLSNPTTTGLLQALEPDSKTTENVVMLRIGYAF